MDILSIDDVEDKILKSYKLREGQDEVDLTGSYFTEIGEDCFANNNCI